MIDVPRQGTLFATPKSSLLGLALTAGVSDREFCEWLSATKPRWLFDLRPVPRFDIGRLNRKAVFDLFTKSGVRYRDVSGVLRMRQTHDASLASGEVAEYLSSILHETAGKRTTIGVGPVLILLDDPQQFRIAAHIIPRHLHPVPKSGWHVRHYVPQA